MIRSYLKILVGVVALSLTASLAEADSGQGGVRSVLSLGTGVRILSMGGAGVSLANDADAGFWNPAWLAILDRHSFSMSHQTLFEGSELTGASWGSYFEGVGGVGVSFLRLGTDEFSAVNDWVVQNRSISYSTSELRLSLSRGIGERLFVGLTARGLSESLFGSNDIGYGLDAGFGFRSGFWRAGAMLRDVIPAKLTLGTITDSSPFATQLGASGSELAISDNLSAAVAIDLEFVNGQSAKLRTGGELALLEKGFLRLGYDDGDPTFGLGFNAGDLRIDYAYRSTDDLTDFHRFGFVFGFGSTPDERRELTEKRVEIRAKNIADAYVAHERQTQAATSYQRAMDFESDTALDSAAFYYRLTLTHYANYLDASQKLAAVEGRVAEQAKLAAEAAVQVGGAESLIDYTVELALRLAAQNRYRSALEALEPAGWGSTLGSTLDSTLSETAESLRTQRDDWRNRQLQRASSQVRANRHAAALGIYASLMREFPTDKGISTALTAVASDKRVEEALDTAEGRLELDEYVEALSLVDAALAFDSLNSRASALREDIVAAYSKAGGLDAIAADSKDWSKMSRALGMVRSGELKGALAIFHQLADKYPANQEVLRNKLQLEMRLRAAESGE